MMVEPAVVEVESSGLASQDDGRVVALLVLATLALFTVVSISVAHMITFCSYYVS